jgi:thiamine biosynthesis lipoprotein
MSDSGPEPVMLARHAMATRFELVLHGENPVSLRAAGEEALDEIERLENLLSLYRTSSEIAHVNARAFHEPVRVSVPVFRLLSHALQLSEATGGAFDMTVGPLLKCWGFIGESGRMPTHEELADARARVGWHHVALDETQFTVRFRQPGMMLDLGAIGKGYAIDCAVTLLREAGVTSGILHGGTSSIYAIGHPPDAAGWKIALRQPSEVIPEAESLALPMVTLRDEALSVSAVWGKSFQAEATRFGHIIDPRTGQPAGHTVLASVVLPSTTESDALSTALLALGRPGLAEIARFRPLARSLAVQSQQDGLSVAVSGW